MKAHYQQDRELIESLCPNEKDKFESWLKKLNEVHSKSKHYGDELLEKATGIHCWFDYFTDGYEPEEALEEDLNAA
ncbi:hypothetical protein [Pseudoalteromonas galatheae]|uniref:hypothetical protein n=1 Tax=Pseudoalteromonas galatheae TaxID=579562 RepID=UPI0030D19036